ncbi:MAG: galactokinase [Promethearchaeota archaeon]
MKKGESSAPGRVCLFGEHQDYLGLAVIPAAINMRTTIRYQTLNISANTIKIQATDLDKSFEFEIKEKYEYTSHDLGYFQAAVEVLAKHEYLPKLKPLECEVSSQIPIKSGLSSSAALLVAWIQTLNKANDLNLTTAEVGMLAYEAEHDILKIPCGMMDQLISAFGGIIHLKCKIPPIITQIKANIEGIVVADTKIHKSTANVHSVRVKETKNGLEKLKELIDYDLELTPFEVVEPYLESLNETEKKRIIAVFKNRDITNEALRILKSGNVDYDKIGKLLNRHQYYLREYFEVSIKKIDDIIEAAMNQGAIGGKLTGAGLGGSIVILAPNHEQSVAQAIKEADGIPYIVKIDGGMT